MESRMHLKFRRKVPRASRKPKSSQNARVDTILKASRRDNRFGELRQSGRTRSTLAEH